MRHAPALALALAACQSPRVPAEPPVRPSTVVVPAAPETVAPVAAKPRPAARRVESLGYTADGSLVVVTSDVVVAYSRVAEIARQSLAPGDVASWEGTAAMSIESNDGVRLLALPRLEEVYRGRARRLYAAGDAITFVSGAHADEGIVLRLPGAPRVRELTLPARAKGGSARAIQVTASGRFAVVTVSVPDDAGEDVDRAFGFDVASGRELANAFPEASIASAPATTFDGDSQIGFRGGDLEVVDLATGATMHRTHVPCGDGDVNGYHVRGNPTLDPTRHRLVVTCDLGGILYDYPSLRRVRRLPKIVPGCDNGFDLSGRFSEDGTTLLLRGCGGESRLDLRTGRYLCGDSDGLMGAPYPMGPVTDEPRPAKAIGVPACRTDEQRALEDARVSAHYAVAYEGETRVLTGPNHARVVLATGEGALSVTADESRVAVVEGSHVVERELPGGAVLHDVEP